MQRGVYFDAWFPRQHCYHPSLPPRRLRMVDDLVDYRATMLVWSALGGGSLALPYLEQEAFGAVSARDRFYGFVNDSEFIAACHERGIKVYGIVFEAQGWEFPVELNDDESEVLAINELRGVGHRGWLGLREFSSNRYPRLWPALQTYFPGGLTNSDGERVDDLIAECVARDIDGRPCHAHWVECPDRDHQCFYMDRNNPVWRAYLKAVIKIQIDAGVDGIQLDEAELPLGAMQYGACFCSDCMKGFRTHLAGLDPARLPESLRGSDLSTFHYGDWLRAQGHDFRERRAEAPLFGEYYRYQCGAIAEYFAELAQFARTYGRSVGRQVAVSGNFFNLDPHYLPLSDHVDVIITEMRNTTYRQPEWYRYVAGFARYSGTTDVVVVENPYGGVVPELVTALGKGRGYDRMRLSLYEGAAFGANMTVPYGSWLGSRLQDSFWAPHELLVEVQSFLADHDQLFSSVSVAETAVVYSVRSNAELVARADASDNVLNARDESVRIPYREVTTTLADAAVPFDVLLFTDGDLAEDRLVAADLAGYAAVLLPGCWWLTEHQADTLLAYLDDGGRVVVVGEVGTSLDERRRQRLLEHPGVSQGEPPDPDTLQPAGRQVLVDADLAVHLHELDGGATAVHLVNYDYDEEADAVVPRTDVRLVLRGPSPVPRVRLVRPGRADVEVPVAMSDGRAEVRLDHVDCYAIVVFSRAARP